jgi:aspartate/methionine/tyrosine aminotransferase
MELHPLAADLNAVLSSTSPSACSLLSRAGKALYFPWKGILGQGGDANGKEINATIGIALEDDGSPMRLSAIADGLPLPPEAVFPYASSFGVKALREVWRDHIGKTNPSLRVPSSMPVVTAGITHALSVASLLFADAGDDVILFNPFWDNYELLFRDTGGARLRTVPLFADGGLNVDGFRNTLGGKPGKRLVLLNFPNNPTGYTPTMREAEEIKRALIECADAGNDIAVLIDDAYAGLVYEDGVFGASLFSLLADCHERVLAVKIDGASKEAFAWGLRIGFITFAGKGLTEATMRALEEKAGGAVRGSVSNVTHLSQELLLRALKSAEWRRERGEKVAILERRFRRCKELFSKTSPHYSLLPCNSGYFLCLKLHETIEAEQVRQRLLSHHDAGVIALPGNLLRIAYSALPEAKIEGLVRSIDAACAASLI